MLPTYLSIDGLYSYQTKQEIDFTQLTEAGLFGIFGKVGSGKSSIIEAMTFALYGDTNRLNSKNRAYNMMNLNANQLKIVFEFIGKENKKYAFEASWKRSGKHFEKVSTIERKAYVYEQGVKIPLDSNDAEAVIGISYKNFNRTVIVPQGQFKEFLELKGTDRSQMMKELFNLDTYDLFQKTAHLKSQNQSAIEQLQGSLQTLSDYTAEALHGLQENLEQQEKDLATKEQTFKQAEQQLNAMNEAQELHRNLAQKEADLANMQQQKEAMQALKERVFIFEKTEKVFKNKIEQLTKEQSNWQDAQALLKATQTALEALAHQEVQLLTAYKAALQQYEQIIPQQTKIAALENLVQYKAIEADLSQLTTRLEKGTALIATTRTELQQQKALYDAKVAATAALKQQKTDTSLLLAVDAWFQKSKTITEKVKEYSASISEKEQKKETLLAFFETQQLTPKTAHETLATQLNTLREKAQKLQAAMQKLEVQKQLAQFAFDLHDGAACPLCGAKEHPEVMAITDVSEQLTAITQQSIQNQKEEEQLLALQREVALNLDRLELLCVEQQQEQEKQALSMAAQTAHFNAFAWPQFDPLDDESFKKVKIQSQETEIALQKSEEILHEMREKLEKLRTDVEKFTNAITEIETQSAF